jgi:GTP cyclohydrolase II
MSHFTEAATIQLRTTFGSFLLTAYETHYASQPQMNYALAIKTSSMPQVPIVRVQSSCVLGEVFHTYDCDCGEQLDAALTMIAEKGGILFYLDQEGRGHGLINKIKELQLQQTQGLDTVEASERLDLPADQRDFTVVGDILKHLNITEIQLLTNNPKKIKEITATGISISERLPLEIQPNPHNLQYLTTKKFKLGHLLTKYIDKI